MKKISLLCLFGLVSHAAVAQHKPLPFGMVSYKDLEMKSYPADTAADAVVLNELGQAFINMDIGKLVFERYLKIKILSKNGLSQADFEIPLYKSKSGNKEMLVSIDASTYNVKGVSITETKLDIKKVFTENFNRLDLKKFALPEVRVGSVIEIRYKVESDYYWNFQTWEFQSDLPKVHSEFLAMIPGTYLYNITLKGFLDLKTNESSIIKDCFSYGEAKAECILTRYGMDNIPAIKAETNMTSLKNYTSALYFEISEVRHLDGRVEKLTKTWKDVEHELDEDDRFGKQIRKARNVLSDKVKEVAGLESDQLRKAKLIYNFIVSHYTWNEVYGIYTDQGVKKAFETQMGNSADINLSMVGALQEAGLEASPVVLSTRDNGLPIELYPIISGFNYVVAAATIDGVVYLLDGTNALRAFGVLPMRCLNGKGRMMSKEISSWIELTYKARRRTVISMDIALNDEGSFKGKLAIAYSGYAAMDKRYEILHATSQAEYLKGLQHKFGEREITGYEVESLKDVDKQLVEKMDISIPTSDQTAGASIIFLNPFLINRLEENPYKSQERIYPVDYGAPEEEMFVLSITFPPSMTIDELPKSIALSLPDGGGRYSFSVTQLGNKLSIISNRNLSKAMYNSNEYHYLKELYARILQIEQSQIVFKRK